MRKVIFLLSMALAPLSDPLQADEPPKATVMNLLWQTTLPPYKHYDDDEKEKYSDGYEWCQSKIQAAREELRDKNQPLISEYLPIVAGEIVIAQTMLGSLAYSLEGDKRQKPEINPGELYWAGENDRCLTSATQHAVERRDFLKRIWQMNDRTPAAWQLFENSLIGHNTVGNRLLFVVNDFDVSPFPWTKKAHQPVYGDKSRSNAISSIELQTGKWVRKTNPVDLAHKAATGLHKSIFLGPPVEIDNRIFVINEQEKELHLLQLDQNHRFHYDDTPESKGILSTTLLVTAQESAADDHPRRMHALHIAVSDKLFICPTHLGALVAVDRKTMKPAWTAKYGKLEDARFVNFAGTWKVTQPIVSADKVIYAPADANALFAFELATGALAWKNAREGGIYLAGIHDGKVLIVERESICAVNVKDGKVAWKTPLPALPSGKGVLHEGDYYLPLDTVKTIHDAEVRVFDLKDGKCVAVLQTKGKEAFGNLAIHKGKLISQTFESLSAFKLP